MEWKDASDKLAPMKSLCVLLLLSVSAFAAKHAPLPDGLVHAKTVYIVNQTGDQNIADKAYQAFTEWKRFDIAKTKETADIVAVFSHESGLHQGSTVGFTEMKIWLPNADEPAFQAIERYGMFTSATKNCIRDLRQRLEDKK